MSESPLSWTLARRAARLNPSTIREILKLTERPGIISLAGGLPAPARISGRASRCRTISLAVTPRGREPSSRTRMLSGMTTRTAPVTKPLAISVVPTPKATQPSAPE